MNSVNFTGRIAKDLELKVTANGRKVTSFSLAVKRPFAKDTTDFFEVVAWENQAEFVTKYFKKGSTIAISGYLYTRSYDDKDGKKRYVTEINAEKCDFCGDKPTEKCDSGLNYPTQPQSETLSSEDELPF